MDDCSKGMISVPYVIYWTPLLFLGTHAALELKDDYLKAYMRRAQACEALEKYEEALEGSISV